MQEKEVVVSDQVRIVLVEPSHPGNIGAAARAMKTMGLSQLVLVRPKRFPDQEATCMASGADDLLAKAQVVETLSEALADCHHVYGTSARQRYLTRTMVDARECASQVTEQTLSGQVAIMFGTERSGLDNEALSRCHYHVLIPTQKDFWSLNLSQAVQIVCYELRMATLRTPSVEKSLPVPQGDELANMKELEGLCDHWSDVMQTVEFLNLKQPKLLLERVRGLLTRVVITKKEINILRGFLSAVEKKLISLKKTENL